MPRAHRLVRLFEHASDLDAIVCINDPPDPTFFWATGLHRGGTFEGSAVVLRPDERPLVLTYPLEETTARRSDNNVVLVRGQDGIRNGLAEHLAGARRIGIDHSHVSVQRLDELRKTLPDVSFENAKDAIHKARTIKDDDEVAAIRAACAITDQIADAMEDLVNIASTEAELAAEIVAAILREGAKTSFDPIVAVGANAAEPHYAPAKTPLDDGPLLVDMGARLEGYCSDITRTYTLGRPSKEFREMHDVVGRALEAAIDAARPGATAADVHAAASKVIEGSPFKGRFIHSTGHGLGVEVHDPGRLYDGVKTVLEPGMVYTIEPGVYVPDEGGVRIEEDIVITADGCDQLTRANRTLRDLRE